VGEWKECLCGLCCARLGGGEEGEKGEGAIARVLDVCINSRMVPLSWLKRRRRRENFADAEDEG